VEELLLLLLLLCKNCDGDFEGSRDSALAS
jgi:hypothetical protein